MIPRSTWSRPGARETGPRRGRTVVPLGALPCERLRNARRFLPTTTHPVNDEPSRATNAQSDLASVAVVFESRRNSMSVAVSQQKMFVDGGFVDALSGETMEVLNPATGEVIAEVPKARRGGRGPRGPSRREGVGDLARQDAEGPHGAALEARRRDRRERRGARTPRVAQRRQAVVGRRRRARRHVRQPPLLRRRGAKPRGEGRDRIRRGVHVDDPPRAARHRGRDRAVELPALHGDVEAGPRARRRERPDHQARRADAAHGAAVRRARAGVPAAGRPPGRHG